MLCTNGPDGRCRTPSGKTVKTSGISDRQALNASGVHPLIEGGEIGPTLVGADTSPSGPTPSGPTPSGPTLSQKQINEIAARIELTLKNCPSSKYLGGRSECIQENIQSDITAVVDPPNLLDLVNVALIGLQSLNGVGQLKTLLESGGLVFSSGGDSAVETSTSDVLSGLAIEAQSTVGEGSGPVYGTSVHTAFASEINALGRSDLSTEVSYLNGEIVPYATRGSVRLDVVEGNPLSPTAVYDLKTGSATLTPARIAQIQANLPAGYQNVPVIEIRP